MFIQSANSLIPIRIAIFLLAVLLSIAAGASILIFPSVYAPVMVGAVMATFIFLAICISKPTWALYMTLLMIFLPIGLIPPEWQSTFNRILSVVAIAVWIVDAVFHHKRILWSSAHWFFLGFLTWSAVSLFWAENLDAGLTTIQAYSLRFILFFMVLLNQIRVGKDLDRLMGTLAIIGWGLVITSIAFILLTGYLPGARLQVLETNMNGLGIIALMALPGILWKTLQSKKSGISVHHLLATVYFFLIIVLTAFSGSRGSAISLIITMLALLVFRPTRSWALVCLALLLMAAAFVPSIFINTIERFLGVTEDLLFGGREFIWPATIDLITDHPWFGVGIGNSSFAVIPYIKIYGSVTGNTQASPHNPLLAILADVGIPGLLLYLGILFGSILSAIRAFRYQGNIASIRLYPYISLVFSVFLGYMASWIKGGGMESEYSYFLMLTLLLIPANMNDAVFEKEL